MTVAAAQAVNVNGHTITVSSLSVTNGEFRGFLEDGGYANPLLWLSDGWDRRSVEGWEAPLYWERRAGRWFRRERDRLRELGFRVVSIGDARSQYERTILVFESGKELRARVLAKEITGFRNRARSVILEFRCVHGYPLSFWIARHTRSGVNGILMVSTPNADSASATAL